MTPERNRKSAHVGAGIFRSPDSYLIQARRETRARAAALACESPADSLACRMLFALGVIAPVCILGMSRLHPANQHRTDDHNGCNISLLKSTAGRAPAMSGRIGIQNQAPLVADRRTPTQRATIHARYWFQIVRRGERGANRAYNRPTTRHGLGQAQHAGACRPSASTMRNCSFYNPRYARTAAEKLTLPAHADVSVDEITSFCFADTEARIGLFDRMMVTLLSPRPLLFAYQKYRNSPFSICIDLMPFASFIFNSSPGYRLVSAGCDALPMTTYYPMGNAMSRTFCIRTTFIFMHNASVTGLAPGKED